MSSSGKTAEIALKRALVILQKLYKFCTSHPKIVVTDSVKRKQDLNNYKDHFVLNVKQSLDVRCNYLHNTSEIS